jgi:DNA polymerase III delta subunit
MLYVYHGDGSGTSRKLLSDAVAKDKASGHEIRTLEGDKLAPRDLESALSTASLFSVESIIIENLLSRLRSKDKEACIDLVSTYKGDKNIYLWDKKEVTPANLKKFVGAKISNSKSPTALFDLLDSLYPTNARSSLTLLQEVVAETEDIIVFTMIARQISYLIIAQSATVPKLPPWQISKLKIQAGKWSLPLLKQFISELTNIDFQIKTGRSKLTYKDHLDLLLSTLLR